MDAQHVLTNLLNEIVSNTIYKSRIGEISATTMRELHFQGALSGQSQLKYAELTCPRSLVDALVGDLRRILVEYVDPATDSVGKGLTRITGGLVNPSLEAFAEDLIWAASTLGTDRAVGILFGWVAGEPIQYEVNATLAGVNVDQPLSLEEGIRIQTLPRSTADLPDTLVTHVGHYGILGFPYLSIDATGTPALYAPSTEPNIQCAWAHERIPSLSLDTFCEALSLACNGCVRWKHSWSNLGDLGRFNDRAGGGMSWRSDVSDMRPGTTLSQEHVEEARDIHLKYHSKERRQRLDLSVPIFRWISSKRQDLDLVNGFIELRIALESLYLGKKGGQGELGFRLATYGAWDLGSNADERCEYQRVLNEAYALASYAVHQGRFSEQRSKKALEILTKAQDACRKGILKRIEATEEPGWDRLIMGG